MVTSQENSSSGSSGSSSLDSDESDEEEFSNFSQLTLNNFLKKKMDYQSVNMMIQIEYCSGSTLKDFLAKRNEKPGFGFLSQDGVIDRSENLAIFTDVINGMAEIHKNFILHRDLKPENIFIGEKEGNLVGKIGDFGLAWMLNGNHEEQ